MIKSRWISFKVFNSGSRLQLICILKLATAKPDYIFWWDFDEDMIMVMMVTVIMSFNTDAV